MGVADARWLGSRYFTGELCDFCNGDGGRERAERGFSSKAFRNDRHSTDRREKLAGTSLGALGGGNDTRRRRATAAQAVGRGYTVPGWWRQPKETEEVK
ncbi:hypothetical protein CIB48_g12178 [Xylaria polymorpha]|nr:hypothetical protein CIB48_g12178 [Xylaria polymorpha]